LRSAGIEIGTELEADLPMVWGDEDQLHQVVTNLVINAQQALLMSEPPRRLNVSTRSDGGMVEVVIHDNGPGIPEEVRTRIFEPFFTTKDAGSGTGVGLSVCRAIVTAHEGRIEVETAPGGSTAIIVRLPSMQSEQPAAEAEADHEKDMPAISANVLVLDDEADIATMIAEILRQDGHVVEIAKDALSALRIIEHADVDLIVSDLRMPGLDGPGLYHAIREKRPELIDRLLFITGDVLAADIDRFLTRTGAAVVEKPLDPAALRRAVAGRLIEMEGGIA
jgi:CheY-like chemotaxis protein